MNELKFPNVVIDISGPQGNAYAIIGLVQEILRNIGEDEKEIKSVINDMMSSDYNHLCDIASKYVTLIGRN